MNIFVTFGNVVIFSLNIDYLPNLQKHLQFDHVYYVGTLTATQTSIYTVFKSLPSPSNRPRSLTSGNMNVF